MSLEPHYLRGAFAVYPPKGQLHEPPQFIPFRFNPENLTRTFAAEKVQLESDGRSITVPAGGLMSATMRSISTRRASLSSFQPGTWMVTGRTKRPSSRDTRPTTMRVWGVKSAGTVTVSS